MSGGEEVGRVSIRVVPNTKGFRRRVESELSSLRDVRVPVNGDTEGLKGDVTKSLKSLKTKIFVRPEMDRSALVKQSINAAKAARTNVTFDAVLNKSQLLRSATQEAKSLSGIQFSYKAILDARFKDPSFGVNRSLPGLKRDLVFLRDMSKHITLNNLGKSLIKTSQGVEKLRRGFSAVGEGVKTLGVGLRKTASAARNLVSPILLVGKTLKWATGGYFVDRQMLKFFNLVKSGAGRAAKAVGTQLGNAWGHVRSNVQSAASAMKGRIVNSAPYVAASKAVSGLGDRVDSLKESFKDLKSAAKNGVSLQVKSKNEAAEDLYKQIEAFRKLDAARKAFNRNKKGSYDPELHNQYKKLVEDAKALRHSDPLKAFKDLPDVVQRSKELQKALGANAEQLKEFDRAASTAQGSFDRLKRAMRARDISLRVSDSKDAFLDSKAVQKAKAAAQKVNAAARSVGASFKSSSAGAELDRLINKTQALGRSFRAVGASAERVGITGLVRKFSDVRKEIDRGVPATQRLGNAFKRVGSSIRGAFSGDAEKSIERVSRAAKKGSNVIHHSSRKILGLTRMGWIVGAIAAIAAPAIQLVSGAVAALPALGLAAGAALGVTVLGFQGIKDAATQAAPALEEVKTAISGVFSERLSPQFAQIGGWLQSIKGELAGVANGMSDFSQGFVDGLTGAKGLESTNELLGNTAGLFSNLKPFASSFTSGLLEMGAAGSRAFGSLSNGLNSFGETFSNAVHEMSQSGALQSAVEDTFTVLGNLSMNIGRILRAGIESSSGMIQPLTALFDGFANGVIGLLPAFTTVASTILTVVGELFTQLGNIGQAFAPGLESIGNVITPFFTGLITQVGTIITGLAPMFNNLFGALEGPLLTFGNTFMGFLSQTISGMQPLFDTLGQVGETVGSSLGAAITSITTSLGPVLPQLSTAISGVANAMGGVLLAAVQALAPVLPVIGEALGTVAAALGESLATALTAITPMLQQLAPIIGETLSTALQAIAPVIPMIADAFVQLITAITPLLPQLFQMAMQVFPILLQVIQQLAPVFPVLVGAFLQLLPAVLPLLPPLLQLAMAVLPPLLSIIPPLAGLLATVANAFAQILTAIMPAIGALVQIIGVFAQVLAAILGWAAGALAAVVGWVAGVIGAIAGWAGSFIAMIAGACASALSTIASWVSSAVSFAASLPGKFKSALGNLGSLLVDSGRALVQGFIDGIKGMIGAVAGAAKSVVQAARDFFPFSPAKKGPFSGKGYTTHSGKALVKDFAKGMRSEKGTAAKAAGDVVSETAKEFRKGLADPGGSVEAYHRQAILQPVLESNAKKIADHRKKELEDNKRLADEIDKINKSKGKAANKERRIAQAREKYRKKDSESYKKLMESLDKPDYSKIPRSIEKYWIEGVKGLLTKGLSDGIRNSKLAAKTRGAALAAVKEGRKTFGKHPIFSTVEKSVNAKHFEDTIVNAIEDAGIAEVPIELVISNLDQLKSDLGMGDGVISRALDQVMQFDPAESDSNKAKQNESKTEVHYHVQDMNEAIRLEKLRERKQLMKIK